MERSSAGSWTWFGTRWERTASSAFSAGRFLAMLRIDCNCSCELWLSDCCWLVCAFTLEMSDLGGLDQQEPATGENREAGDGGDGDGRPTPE